MRFPTYVFLFSLVLLPACQKEKKGMTKIELQNKADSILLTHIPDLKQRAKEDLNNRLPIELKPKVDSILNISYIIPPLPTLDDSDSEILNNNTGLIKNKTSENTNPKLNPDLKKASPLLN